MKRRLEKTNPVANAMLRATLRKTMREDITRLLAKADFHAWTSAHVANMVQTAGDLVFIVLGAVEPSGLTAEDPDVRICRGMGEALGDLVADGRLEFHRGAIKAGLVAIERLLPQLDELAMAQTALELRAKLRSTHGVKTADLHAFFQHDQSKAAA